jgi:hypothetical protein
MVVEAEKTPKEKVQRAKTLLAASRANVFAVLNKTKTYGPKSLNSDL